MPGHTVPMMTTSREAPAAAGQRPRVVVRDLTAVVRAVAEGDVAAFAYVYDRLAPVVHGIARRVLRDEEAAAEVTRDVMLEMWRDAARYVPTRGSVAAWAAEAAHRRAVERAHAGPAPVGEDTGAPEQEVGGVVHEEWAATADLVTSCLAELSEEERAVVLLTYFDGRRYPEVAQELGLAERTVHERLRTGLARLRRCLGAG